MRTAPLESDVLLARLLEHYLQTNLLNAWVESWTIDRSQDMKESAEMHRKIYRAIRARDVEVARNTMSQHLILAEQALASEEGISAQAIKSGEDTASNGKVPTP